MDVSIDEIIKENKLLTAQEVATILRVSPSKVYRLARERRLRAVKMGGNVRVRPTDLQEYIRSSLTS